MILIEVTGEARFSLPIFITVMIARWVGDHVMKVRGIYDLHIIELKGVPLLEAEPEPEMLKMTASEIMAPDPVTCSPLMTVRQLYDKLQDKEAFHNGFPVICGSQRGHRPIGVVTRNTLLALYHYVTAKGSKYHYILDQVTEGVSNEFGMLPTQSGTRTRRWSDSKIPVIDHAHMMKERLTEKSRPSAVPDDDIANRILDITPYMNSCFQAVPDSCSMANCYDIFRKQGLRHLLVVQEGEGTLVGIITRKDLILVHFDEDKAHTGREARRLEQANSQSVDSDAEEPDERNVPMG